MAEKCLMFVSLFCVSVWRVEAGHSWSYQGRNAPCYWEDSFPKCGGKHQSPVDIANAIQNQNMSPLVLDGYERQLKEATLVNNGHSAQVEYNDAPAMFTGGCLDGEYKFVQFHFHWGSDNRKGSEHTVDGKRYAMEGHFVHFNIKYGEIREAVKHPDGIAVLGVFYNVSRYAVPEMDILIDAVKKVQDKMIGSKVSVDEGLVMKSLLPEDMSFYCYRDGSLTTPSCDEAVVWTILQIPVTIGQVQINAFRKLKYPDGSPMVNNFRPLQSTNGRTIYSFKSRK